MLRKMDKNKCSNPGEVKVGPGRRLGSRCGSLLVVLFGSFKLKKNIMVIERITLYEQSLVGSVSS